MNNVYTTWIKSDHPDPIWVAITSLSDPAGERYQKILKNHSIPSLPGNELVLPPDRPETERLRAMLLLLLDPPSNLSGLHPNLITTRFENNAWTTDSIETAHLIDEAMLTPIVPVERSWPTLLRLVDWFVSSGAADIATTALVDVKKSLTGLIHSSGTTIVVEVVDVAKAVVGGLILHDILEKDKDPEVGG